MARVYIFLKDDLLDEINAEALEEGTNRSALIQAALEEYLQGETERELFLRNQSCLLTPAFQWVTPNSDFSTFARRWSR